MDVSWKQTLTSKIIGAAMAVHSGLGPGLLESVYQKCLALELRKRGLKVQCEVPVEINYSGEKITDEGFRIDLLVADEVVVELKAVEVVLPVHKKQVLTYLKLSGRKIGLLINFNVEMLRDGIERLVSGVVAQVPGTTSHRSGNA